MKYQDLQPGKTYKMYLTHNEVVFRVNGKIQRNTTNAAWEIWKMAKVEDFHTASHKMEQAQVSLAKIRRKYHYQGQEGEVLGTHKVQGYVVEILVMPRESKSHLHYWTVNEEGQYFRSSFLRTEYEEATEVIKNIHKRTEEGIYHDYTLEELRTK